MAEGKSRKRRGYVMSKKLIVCASPRIKGRSSHIASFLSERLRGKGVEVELFSLAQHPIAPCTACDACMNSYTCIIKDDMRNLYPILDTVDELIVVSPVYFSGPPAQFKALLDRLQPYYWKARGMQRRKAQITKRPVTLYVVGQGGDPHGFEPLIGCVRSATALAGFSLERVCNCVGLSDEDFDKAFEADTLNCDFRDETALKPWAPQAHKGDSESGAISCEDVVPAANPGEGTRAGV